MRTPVYKAERKDLAKANDNMRALARDTGNHRHYVLRAWNNECICGHVAKDNIGLGTHIRDENLNDQANGQGRQKYGSIEIGGCKVNVHFSMEGTLMVSIFTGDAEPELGHVRVRVATDCDNLQVAG